MNAHRIHVLALNCTIVHCAKVLIDKPSASIYIHSKHKERERNEMIEIQSQGELFGILNIYFNTVLLYERYM